jgi:DNA integrity scanning protein DisA with diadenylate cyclase activity
VPERAVTPSATPVKALPPLVGLACDAVARVGAGALVVLPDGPLDWKGVRETAGDLRVLAAVSSERQADAARAAGLLVIELEPTDAAITEQITLALIQAVADDQLQAGDRVVVAYSGFEDEVLDSITVMQLGEHLERLTARDLRALETHVPFETLKAVVDVAVEIGREGREGNAVGTLIVVGDAREVLARSRTLGFDPFRGYRRKERNLRDGRVREAIKEIAQLDGAFVVSRDGTVEAACRIIDAPTTGLSVAKGLGTRHWAAAAITRATDAIAVVISQSTGNVRLFQDGEVVLRIAPTRHARALKWTDSDSEPAPPKPERERERGG